MSSGSTAAAVRVFELGSQPQDRLNCVDAFREPPDHVLQAWAEEVDLAHLRGGGGASGGSVPSPFFKPLGGGGNPAVKKVVGGKKMLLTYPLLPFHR